MRILRICCLVCTVGFASLSFAQDSRPSSSNNLKVFGTVNTVVPFDIKDEGIKFPVRWGVDVAWINEQNVRKGINHMGKENVTIVRGSFQTSKPLQDDSVLTSSHISTLNTRMRLANLVSDTAEIILNEDQEAGIDNYYCVNGKADAKHWASLINASVKWIQANYPKHPVVAVSPFNEPDYTSWGQGSRADFKEIARILKEEYPRFKDIAITAGNTLNCDQALSYSIDKLQDRGKFFIDPGEEVYYGQVVGEHVHENDLVINVTKAKQLTNVRASGTDEKARIIPKVVMSLEECLEYIKADEYVEVTPKSMRMRKIILDHLERKRANKE